MTSYPPKGLRGRPIPVTALIVVSVLVTGAFAVADNPTTPVVGGAAASYVPPEGYMEWSVARSPDSPDIRRVSEHSRSTGFSEVLALPETQAAHALEALTTDVRTTQFWRETTHVLDGDDQRPLTDLYAITDDGVALVAGYGGTLGWVYNPPIVQLPPDVAPGVSWSGTGEAMPFGIVTYAHEAAALAATRPELVLNAQDRGIDVASCVQIDGVTQLFDEEGALAITLESSELWCQGHGRLATVNVIGGVETTYLATTPRAETVGVNASPKAAGWADPSTWVTSDVALTLSDEFFGAKPLSVGLADSPRTTASGLVITANTNTADIVALTPQGTELVRAWYAHPGGDIVTFATVGDVTVVSTGLRRLVAYDGKGHRLWQHEVAELITAPPTPGDDGRVVTVGLDGTVTTFDAVTGAVRWTRSVSADVDQSAVLAKNRVIVIDRAGAMTAFNAGTGDVEWKVETEPAAGLRAFDDLVVVAGDDGWLRAFALSNGDTGHSTRYRGALRALLSVDGHIVLATDEAVLALDVASARELWRRDGIDTGISDGTTLIGFRGATAVALDGAGGMLATWDVPASQLWSTRYVVTLDDAFVLMHTGSEATIVGAR